MATGLLNGHTRTGPSHSRPGSAAPGRGRRSRPRWLVAAMAAAVVAVAVVGLKMLTGGPPKVVVATAGPAVVQAQPSGAGSTSALPDAIMNVVAVLNSTDGVSRVASVAVVPGQYVARNATIATIDGMATSQGLQVLQTKLAQAQAELAASRAAESNSGFSSQASIQVAQDQGTVALLQNQIALAEQNSSTVIAPTAGVVEKIDVARGSVVHSAQTVVTLVDTSSLLVSAAISLADSPGLEPGQPATVTFPELPGRIVTGQVRAISPTATNNGLDDSVVVQIPNIQSPVIPVGAKATVVIQATHPARVTVPLVAVVTPDLDPSVWVYQDGHVHLVQVELGSTDMSQAEILSGLRPGQRVVLSNFQKLSDGARVEASTARP